MVMMAGAGAVRFIRCVVGGGGAGGGDVLVVAVSPGIQSRGSGARQTRHRVQRAGCMSKGVVMEIVTHVKFRSRFGIRARA